MPVNDYAIPRMEPGKQRPIQSMDEARDWERRFIGEVKAGLDPSRLPSLPKREAKAEIETVSAFLDAYFERCAKPAGLRSFATESQVRRFKEQLGHLTLETLEDPDEINRFKASSDYAEDLEIASIHRLLEPLRAAMNWGLAQTRRSSRYRRSIASAWA